MENIKHYVAWFIRVITVLSMFALAGWVFSLLFPFWWAYLITPAAILIIMLVVWAFGDYEV